jgi:hypothetical protein
MGHRRSWTARTVRDPSRVAPDAWLHDQALLARIDEIMLDFLDRQLGASDLGDRRERVIHTES